MQQIIDILCKKNNALRQHILYPPNKGYHILFEKNRRTVYCPSVIQKTLFYFYTRTLRERNAERRSRQSGSVIKIGIIGIIAPRITHLTGIVYTATR